MRYIPILLCACCTLSSLQAQIVINEIIPPNSVEIKNLGGAMVPIGAYNLCDFPDYDELVDLTVQCGSLNLGPGQIVVVTTDEIAINGTDSELGLYINGNNFGNPANIVDYVEWGSSGHTRSSVAQSAGIWSAGDFVPSWTSCSSLEYDGTGNSSSDWVPSPDPSTCFDNLLLGCGAGCSLTTAGLTNIGCDNNGTGSDPSDDFITLSLNPQGTMIGASYIVTVSSGVVNPTTGLYGGVTNFSMQAGSAGSGNVTVTATDVDDPACEVLAQILDPGSCSTDCNLGSAGLAAIVCDDNGSPSDPTDDVILFTLNPTGVNLGANYNVTVSMGSISPTFASYGITTAFSLQAGSAGAGNVMLTISDGSDPSCQVAAMVTDPGTCSDACAITTLNLANVTCDDNGTAVDPADDIITFTLDPQGVNLGASYDVNVAMGAVVPTNAAYGGPTTFFLNEGSAGAGNVLVSVSDNDDPTCLDEATITDPGVCSSCDVIGGTISTTDPTDLCLTDELPDLINVTLVGSSGSQMQWVITDPGGVILGLPPVPPFDFTSAGAGTCLIWNISYEPGLTGLTEGANMSNLDGCFDPSNAITVIRSEPVGGTLTTSDLTTVCVGDSLPDLIIPQVTGASGSSMTWVITDVAGTILDVPTAPPFDFEGAGAGVCLIWNLSHEPGLAGLSVGNNVSDLDGCFAFSDSIVVVRNDPDGGMIMTGDPTQICADDGDPDFVNVTLTGNTGSFNGWIIVDLDGMIINLPAAPPFNFEGAGAGVCVIYHVSYEVGLTGLSIGQNIADLAGCYDLSNSISIVRQTGADCNPCDVNGGVISSPDTLTWCVVLPITVTVDFVVMGDTGTLTQWILTDSSGMIQGLPAIDPPYDFVPFPGVTRIWHLSYEPGIIGLNVGMNMSNLMGCFDLSNFLTLTLRLPDAGQIFTSDETMVCVGEPGAIDVTVVGASNDSSTWVITDTSGLIFDVLNGPPFDFQFADPGIYEIIHVSFAGALDGLEPGNNISSVDGCFTRSIGIVITVVECFCNVDGGMISTASDTTICVGEGIVDSVIVAQSGASGPLGNIVVTTPTGEILAVLPSATEVITFENAGAGVCVIYHISYEAGLLGLTEGANLNDLTGCYDLSNTITVIRVEGNDCTTAVNDPELNLRIRMYPNPTTGNLTIETTDLELESVTVFDTQGKQVYAQESEFTTKQDLQLQLRSGLYFIRIQTSAGVVSRKFIVVDN